MNRALLPVLALIAPLVGCAEAEPFLPKVSFSRMDIRDLSWTDIGADFVFEVQNPNPVRVGVASFQYQFDLESVRLLEGDNTSGFQLEPTASSELILPVDLIFAETWDVVEATRGVDDVGFNLSGSFGFDTPIGEVEIPYDEAGSFPALRTPKFRFDRIRLTELTLTQAELALDLDVDNEHASTLFFDNFSYTVGFDGVDFASGLVQTFDVPAGEEAGSITLPITIDLLSAALTIADNIIAGSSLETSLTASVDVDTPFGVLPLTVDEEDIVNIIPL
jgi:LEA14-like dessication related protein